MRGPLKGLTTADVLFWQEEREMWSVFCHVQESALEDDSIKMNDSAFT